MWANANIAHTLPIARPILAGANRDWRVKFRAIGRY